MFIHFLNKTKPHKWTLMTVSCLICFHDFENKKFLNKSYMVKANMTLKYTLATVHVQSVE